MLKAVGRRLAGVMGVGRGEWPRLLSMAGLFGWVMFGWAMGRAGRDAYFIKAAGTEHLPYMYVLSAALMVAVSAVYASVVDRVPRYRLMVGLLALSALALAGLRLAMPFELAWTPYAVFCLAEVFTLFFLMHFWTFANQAFDPREGKRLFPLIGGAGLLGGFVGGLLTRPLVALVGTEDLFLLWAAVLLLAVPLTLAGQRRSGNGQVDGGQEQTGGGLLDTFAYVRGVPLLRTLCYLSLPMWLVVYIVDYQFFLVMDEVFPQQDQLAGFLGMFNSVTALIGLGLQLFVTGWVLRRFGVGRAVWVHPLGMTLGALALAGRSLLPVLPAPRLLSAGALSGVFAKFSDNAIFYSIGEAASQLLFNALPEEWRGRGRAFIAGVVEPACTAVAGAVLLMAQAFDLPGGALSFGALGLCFLWLGWTRRLNGEYLRALAANLNDADPRRSGEAWEALGRHGGGGAAVLAERIEKDGPEVALLALELLCREKGSAVTRQLMGLLPKVNGAVRRAVLDELVRRGATQALAAVEAVWRQGDAPTRAAAVRAGRCLGASLESLGKALEDTDPRVRAEALIAWLGAGRDEGDALLQSMVAGGPVEREWAVYAAGEAGYRPALPQLLRLRHDPEPAVRRRCAPALAGIGGADAAAALGAMLDDPEAAAAAEQACKSLGEDALAAFLKQWDGASPQAGAALARCLGAMPLPEALRCLVGGVEDPRGPVADACAQALACRPPDADEAALRGGLGRALRRLAADLGRWAGWARDLAGIESALLLRDACLRRAARAESLALECVAALGERSAVEAAMANLANPQPRVRAEAIEIIESSGEAARGLVGELERRYLDGGMPAAGQPAGRLWRDLARAGLDPWERACLLYALRAEGETQEHLVFDDREVQDMAANIERILFLKSASLFADVAGGDLPWIDEIAREEAFEEGQFVFREGEMGDSLYIIVEGSVRVVKGEKEPVVLAVLGERDCFGEMALIDGEPRSATIEAERRTRALKIARADFEELLLARPQIGFALIKNLNRRLRETNARLLESGGG